MTATARRNACPTVSAAGRTRCNGTGATTAEAGLALACTATAGGSLAPTPLSAGRPWGELGQAGDGPKPGQVVPARHEPGEVLQRAGRGDAGGLEELVNLDPQRQQRHQPGRT